MGSFLVAYPVIYILVTGAQADSVGRGLENGCDFMGGQIIIIMRQEHTLNNVFIILKTAKSPKYVKQSSQRQKEQTTYYPVVSCLPSGSTHWHSIVMICHCHDWPLALPMLDDNLSKHNIIAFTYVSLLVSHPFVSTSTFA